jgi:hypothetical protein
MRRAVLALALALLTGPAFAQPDCAKPQSEMTPDEYVACVSLGGVMGQMQSEGRGGTSEGSAVSDPSRRALGAGRGVSATASSRDAACARATARAGGRAIGGCQCSGEGSGRVTCTIDVRDDVVH